MADLVVDENSDISNNKDQVESEDESDDEEGRKHEGGHGKKPSSNFYWLRCDIQSCKRWYHDVCVDVL